MCLLLMNIKLILSVSLIRILNFETLSAFISDSKILELDNLDDGINGAGSKPIFAL